MNDGKDDKVMKEMNISKNISILRKQKGITQEQLVLALNISPQAVSKWETNTSQPDTQTLPLIATIEMQRYSLEGVSCCMGYGDYPIKM